MIAKIRNVRLNHTKNSIGGDVKIATGSRKENDLERPENPRALKLVRRPPMVRSRPFRIEVSESMFRPRGIAEQSADSDFINESPLIDPAILDDKTTDPGKRRDSATVLALITGLVAGYVVGRYVR